MISRAEFYIGILLLASLVAYLIFDNKSSYSADRAAIEMRDSVLASHRDIALKKAQLSELKNDSMQKVIDRQNADLNKVHEKYIYIKENVRRLSADSSLVFFLRSIR